MEKFKELVGEELYKQVTEKLGDVKVDVLDGYVPKQRFSTVTTEKADLKNQVDQLTKQLDDLKTSATGNKDLETKIADLQKVNQDWETKYQSTVLNSAIKFEATKHKARNAEDILAFVKREDLKLDESGVVKGLKEQFEDLKKNKAYLFEEEDTNGGKTKPGTNPAGRKASTEEYSDKLKKSFGL